MEETRPFNERFASLSREQEAHVVLLRAMFADSINKIEEYKPLIESIPLLEALRLNIALRQEGLALLREQVAQLREAAKQQDVLLRDFYSFSD